MNCISILGAMIIANGYNVDAISMDMRKQGVGDEFIVSVSSGSLNIRKEPNTSSKVIGKLNKGYKISVWDIKTIGNTEWGKVKVGNDYGWCSMNFLREQVDSEYIDQIEKENLLGKYTVIISSGSLNVRETASVSSKVIGSLKKGDKVNVYEIKKLNGINWGRVKVGNKYGWCSMQYLKKGSQPENTVDSGTTTTQPEEYIVVLSSGSLNVRETTSVSSKVIGSLKKENKVNVYEIKASNGINWGRVKIGNKYGWCSMQYLKKGSQLEKNYSIENTSENRKMESYKIKDIFTEEKIAHTQFLNSDNPKAKAVKLNTECFVYEHADESYKKLFRIEKDSEINVYYILSNGYGFIGYRNIDGNIYTGYMNIYNTTYFE